jgi:hypothetical protein
MECQKVRDRFSSLLEGEVSPLEEKALREHLVSCSECQEDFEKFEKTIHWLHSTEETEVPDGFLSEIRKKMEAQKQMGFKAGKVRPGWFNSLVQLKLPAQAVAMVAIVFLVLYLTKMMPVETPHLMKEVEQKKALQSEAKGETRVVPKEKGKEEGTIKLPSEMSQEKKIDRMVVSKIEEAKSAKASIPKAEAPAVGTPQLKAPEKGKALLSEPGKVAKVGVEERKPYLAAKPPQELILRMADREKALSQLHELIKQVGGEIVKEEGNIVLASLPNASFPEFKKELAGMDALKKADQMALRRETIEGKEAPVAVKRRQAEEKGQEPPKPMTDQESRIFIRVLLVQE